jgi:glycosyltransferase involved in cell wall biosynthesis
MRTLSERVPELRLVFVGKGSRLAQAKDLVRELGLQHVVQFRAFVPLELLPHSLGLADAALVTLLPGFEGLVVPSKLLGYMARAVPTLYVGPDSDVSRLVGLSHGGRCVPAGAVDELADAVERWVRSGPDLRASGEAAAAYYAAHLSKAMGLAAYRDAVARVTGRELPGVPA